MRYNIINWEEVQKKYDDEKISEEFLCEFYGMSTGRIHRAKKKGLFKTRNKKELKEIIRQKSIGRKHTDESKKMISDGRKKFLNENPQMVPYILNHSRNESYPEIYFCDIFEKENINITKKYRIGLYELDFSIPEKKIDIEVDGDQHYLDIKIAESDIRRDDFLKENGWDVIRIRWSDYQKLDKESKCKFISKLKEYISGLISDKPTFEVEKSRKDYNDCSCGNRKWFKSTRCRKCYGKNRIKKGKQTNRKKYEYKCISCENKCSNKNGRCVKCYRIRSRKVERPTYEQLLKDIEETNYIQTGKKYGVTDNSIRKWLKQYKKEEI